MSQKGNGAPSSFEMDDPLFITGCIVFIYVLWIIIWHVFIKEISIGHVYYRYFTSYPIYYLSSFFPDVFGLSYPYHFIQKWCAPEPGLFGKCTADFSQYTKEDNFAIAKPYNIFFLFLMVGISIKMFLKMDKNHPSSKFTKIHNLNSFVKEQRVNYEHLKMFNDIDLIDKSINDPLYGMSLSSKQFVHHYQLISGWEVDSNKKDFVPFLNRNKTEALFIKQLGRPFSGWRNLSTSQKMIFSILIPLCAATKTGLSNEDFESYLADSEAMRKAAWAQFKLGNTSADVDAFNESQAKALERVLIMNESDQKQYKQSHPNWKHLTFMNDEQFEHYKALKEGEIDDLWLTDPEVDHAIFEATIAKYSSSEQVKSILHRFAYINTVIYEMMSQARRLGVLQPAEFRWLRFFDRPLWYVINSIGRRTPYAEAAAVHCHYMAELVGECSYIQPMVNPAIDALNRQIQSYKYTQEQIIDPKGLDEMWQIYSDEKIKRLFPYIPSQKI